MKVTGANWYFALLILAASCSQMSQRSYFPETTQVITRQAGFDSVPMRYPYRVKTSEMSLYIIDLHAADYFCHEFEYPSVTHRRSFVRKGKGPQEVADISNLIIKNDGTVYLLNAFGRKIFTFRDGVMDVYAELPEELTQCLDFAFYNDSVVIIPDYSGKHRLAFVDRKGNIIRRFGDIPHHEREGIPEAALGMAWRSFIHYNPNNGLLAMVTQFGEVLELYDLKTGDVQVVIGPGGEPKCRYKGSTAYPDGIRGYSDVVVGDRYIYALFWGYEYAKMVSGEITYAGGDLIHVFDLEGKPVRQYHLDRRITGFCVNEATGEVIGTDVDNEQLVMFNL